MQCSDGRSGESVTAGRFCGRSTISQVRKDWHFHVFRLRTLFASLLHAIGVGFHRSHLWGQNQLLRPPVLVPDRSWMASTSLRFSSAEIA